ncbi:MAG: hypothetical protein M0R33_15435 [Methylomonas sp.]|jgi:hypothetical protein|uniref:hypothetical protein n=1 Tax=Methylomonas sp. TaxID=418 RepID=UPI0025E3E3B7|nr:hypothetical protein [Methylomonas sp.]MCK9607835.1 hypothetical protein [Methylomonas sp.]
MSTIDSIILEYRSTQATLGVRDGTLTFASPIIFGESKQPMRVRVLKCVLPRSIPNVINCGTLNNRTIRISNNGGVGWTTLTMSAEVTNYSLLIAAINAEAAALAWWANPLFPGFSMTLNGITRRITITLDSTKLAAPGQLGLDLAVSDIHTTLGFTVVLSFIVDGAFTGDSAALLNSWGVYLDSTFNNTVIRISNNGGVAWQAIALTSGTYSPAYINAAINYVADSLGWWADSTDPGFSLAKNLATQEVYLTIDSTKLAAIGQLGIDFSQSDIAYTLGFSATQTFIADATVTADVPSHLDTQGQVINLQITGLGRLRLENSASDNTLVTIPVSSSAISTSDYIYPSGGVAATAVECLVQPTVPALSFTFINARGNNALFSLGDAVVEIELIR